MNIKAKIYAYFIILVGILFLVSNFNISLENLEINVALLFFSLIVLSELISIEATNFSNISLGFSVAFTLIIISSPEQAAMIMYFGFLFSVFEENGKYKHIFNSSIFKRLFNASSYYITAYLSGLFFNYANSIDVFRIGQYGFFALIATILLYLFLNSTIFMGLFAVLSKMSLRDMIIKNIWALKSFFTLSPIGIMMLLFYSSYGWFGLFLFFGPLLLARYAFKLYLNMKIVYMETIMALTNAIDAKDEYTNGHSGRVAEYSIMIGKKLELSELQIETLQTAALLHDIGKIGISDNILLKPGKLDDFEMQLIRNHPMIGAHIIEGIQFLDKARIYISQHHERYDGKGYPNGIKGENMPLESQILAVADVVEAVTKSMVTKPR